MKSFHRIPNSSNILNDNFENDDLATFQHSSKTINLYFSQLP